MNSEVIFTYAKGKLWFRYGIIILAILSVLYGMWILPQWNTVITCLFLVTLVGLIAYIVFVIKKIKSLKYYIKCDSNGIYTNEAFEYCSYKNINDIELKRYMGYQTLYFEVKEANLKTKINPMKENNKVYYCLPLADCEGDPNRIYMEVLDWYTLYRNR